jgi:hypothetical protein
LTQRRIDIRERADFRRVDVDLRAARSTMGRKAMVRRLEAGGRTGAKTRKDYG